MAGTSEHIKTILALLPETPGVYQYFDKEGKIIYVGKAKNLRRRVSSYFNKVHESPKTNILVRNIYDLKYMLRQRKMRYIWKIVLSKNINPVIMSY